MEKAENQGENRPDYSTKALAQFSLKLRRLVKCEQIANSENCGM